MLAMDVVDTLRRKSRLVEQELDVAGREQDLKQRLRKIYAAQGIEVTDAILEEGVRALKEDRFVYKPPPDSFGIKMARLYVNRGVWGKWVFGAAAGLAIGLVAWQLLVVAPRDALPQDLAALHTEVVALAEQDSADQRADALLATARKALRDGDTTRAQALFRELEQMRDQLETSYRIRVVNRQASVAASGGCRMSTRPRATTTSSSRRSAPTAVACACRLRTRRPARRTW